MKLSNNCHDVSFASKYLVLNWDFKNQTSVELESKHKKKNFFLKKHIYKYLENVCHFVQALTS